MDVKAVKMKMAMRLWTILSQLSSIIGYWSVIGCRGDRIPLRHFTPYQPTPSKRVLSYLYIYRHIAAISGIGLNWFEPKHKTKTV